MSGVVPLLPVYAFMTWTGRTYILKPLFYQTQYVIVKTESKLHVSAHIKPSSGCTQLYITICVNISSKLWSQVVCHTWYDRVY